MILRSSKVAVIKPVVPIPYEDWNTAFDELRRNRPLICGSRADGGWRHPWKPSLEWHDNTAFWRVNIKPGYVSGREVEVTMPLDDTPEITQFRAKDDESILVGASQVRARLSEEPGIPIHEWRRIGPDSDPTGLRINETGTGGTVSYETVHPFFLSMGVGTPPNVTYSTTTGRRELVDNVDRSEDRLLRAVEVVLSQERPSVTSEWSFGAGNGTIAQFDVVYAGAVKIRESPYISIRKTYTPKAAQNPVERLRGNWQDDGRDDLHVCTLYLVSPPGAEHGSEPDDTWSPFHQSHLFWNVNHGANILPVTEEPAPLRFLIPLAGGVGQLLIDTLIGDLNDRYDAALEFVNNRSLEGRFWST